MESASCKNHFPHWRDFPPTGYPFKRNLLFSSKEPNFHQPEPAATRSDVRAIECCGDQLLEANSNINALWKFENCLLVCKNTKSHPHHIIMYASVCAMITMKMYRGTHEESKQKKLLRLCDAYCEECFEITTQKLPSQAEVGHVVKFISILEHCCLKFTLTASLLEG